MLLGTLGASSLRNMLAGKDRIRILWRQDIVRERYSYKRKELKKRDGIVKVDYGSKIDF